MNFTDTASKLIEAAERDAKQIFERIEHIEYENQRRILSAFQSERVSDRHFQPTYGYGYDDIGRDTLECVFAKALFCESALVRPQIASGTHALYICLEALLGMNERIVFATGEPYDTLKTAMRHSNAFGRFGVEITEIPLCDNAIDIDAVLRSIDQDVRIVYVQRSRGYEWRNSLQPEDMKALFDAVHSVRSDIITVVDNCYGEFTKSVEPSLFGADIIIGSLIKNPGGGIAPTGGYIAGRSDLIDIVADRFTVPGIGREIGSYAASYLPFYQGLFMAPHTTAQALKTAVLFSRVFEILGMESSPNYDANRSDIVQALRFPSADSLIDFCVTIQSCAPIDSYVVPEPWDMPGYADKVIMAAGTFIQGSSIELTADAPMREPYTAYIQGALTYGHGLIAAQSVTERFIEKGYVKV